MVQNSGDAHRHVVSVGSSHDRAVHATSLDECNGGFTKHVDLMIQRFDCEAFSIKEISTSIINGQVVHRHVRDGVNGMCPSDSAAVAHALPGKSHQSDAVEIASR